MRAAQLKVNAKNRLSSVVSELKQDGLSTFGALALGALSTGRMMHMEVGPLNQHARISHMTKGDLRNFGFSARKLEALFHGSRSLKSCRRLLAGKNEEVAGLSSFEETLVKFGPRFGLLK